MEDEIKYLYDQMFDLRDRLNKAETAIVTLQNELSILKGPSNPGHRPQKSLDTNFILQEIQGGKSARTIAALLNVRPNTVTKRLQDAGYVYYHGKWILEAEKPEIKPMTEEEKEAIFKKLKGIF